MKPYLEIFSLNNVLCRDKSKNSIFSSELFLNPFHSPTALMMHGLNLSLPNLRKEITELITDCTVATGEVNGDQ